MQSRIPDNELEAGRGRAMFEVGHLYVSWMNTQSLKPKYPGPFVRVVQTVCFVFRSMPSAIRPPRMTTTLPHLETQPFLSVVGIGPVPVAPNSGVCFPLSSARTSRILSVKADFC